MTRPRSGPLPTSFAAGMDAAINWGDGRAFFFKGSKYVGYDIETNFVDHHICPRDIAEGWPDFPAASKSGGNAAVNYLDYDNVRRRYARVTSCRSPKRENGGSRSGPDSPDRSTT